MAKVAVRRVKDPFAEFPPTKGDARPKWSAPTAGYPRPLKSVAGLKESVGRSMFRGVQPSVWNFWKHGVTSSFLGSFLTCREQTRLHYVEGWNSRSTPLYFEFGSCMHWVFEQAYTVEGMEAVCSVLGNGPGLRELSQKWVSEYEQVWLAETDTPTQKQLEQQEHVYGLAEGMLPNYFKRWDGDFATGRRYTFGNNTTAPEAWVSLEEVFDVPYTYPDGKVARVRGRRDGVLLDKNGDTWVFDTKCRSVIVDADILDTMAVDLQQMLYLWVTYAQSGVWPRGGIINIPRRPGQRFTKNETLQGLLGRVSKEVGNPKNYDHYFMRFQMAITPAEVLDWKATRLDPIMQDVRAWWEGTAPHYPTDQNLITKYGRAGMFTPITKGEFFDCYRRETPFPELREVA